MTLLFNGIFRKKKDKTYCQNSWDNTEFNAGYRPHQKKEHRPRPSLCCTETGQRSSQGGLPPVFILRERLQHSHSWAKRAGVEFPMGGPPSDLPLGALQWEGPFPIFPWAPTVGSVYDKCPWRDTVGHPAAKMPLSQVPLVRTILCCQGEACDRNLSSVAKILPTAPTENVWRVWVCLFSSLLRQWPVFMATSHRR